MAGPIAQDLIYSAYRTAGILTGPQRGMSASEIADGLECLNALMDEWSADRLGCFSVSISQYTLIPGQQNYTIGIDPAGLVTADFDAERPIEITNANIITQVGGGQQTRVPMELLNDDGWAAISVQNTPSTIPLKLYDDYNSPLSTLRLWPYPSAAAILEIYTWQLLPQYATAGAAFNLPPGYRRALVYNLAVDIANRFPKAKINSAIYLIATETKATLMAKNAPEPEVGVDEALLARRSYGYDYMSDSYVGTNKFGS